MHSYHALVAIALLSIAARPYRDTKDRFSFELAPGWEMTPQFGDTLGMVFKKLIGKRRPTMALFMVRVAPPGTGANLTINQTLLEDENEVYRYVFGKGWSVRLCDEAGKFDGLYNKDGRSIVKTSES